MALKSPRQRISAPPNKQESRLIQTNDATVADEVPLNQKVLNNPARLSSTQIVQLQRTIGNQAVIRLLGHAQPIQRKVFIGAKEAYKQYKPEENDPDALKTLAADGITRRFVSPDEAKAFAGGQTDNMGYMAEKKRWVRLGKFTVIGEDHSDPAAPIITATKTKRFRYEGFSTYSEKRLKHDVLADHIRANNEKRFAKKGLESDKGEHSAEDAVPKYARVMPDMNALIQNQLINTVPKDLNVKPIDVPYLEPGKKFDTDYSLAHTLHLAFLEAMIYLTSYKGSNTKDPLDQFYQKHSEQIENSIIIMQKTDDTIPDYQTLPITKHMKDLISAFAKAAKNELGEQPKDIKRFKAKLDTTDESVVSITKKAKKQDYLRDLSMYKKILEANGKDLLFIIGEAHRRKLAPLLAADKIENIFYDKLLEAEKAEDAKAEKSAEK